MKKPYYLLLLFGVLFQQLVAQDLPVSGKIVLADDNSPLPGVTVLIKGSAQGTTSDIKGKYSLTVPAKGVLVFSYIGMQAQEIPVNGRQVINVKMSNQDIPLGEVVVVGYSTSSKKLLSGSIALVNEDEIKNIPIRTIDGVLTGQTPGLTVTSQSGTPGGQNMIKLRGGSSINASNTPLMVIDGIPAIVGEYSQIGMSGQELNSMSDINPNDIESMTILKDASATAMYGARASNGVILITTKKGSCR